MKIKRFISGPLYNNSYIIYDEKSLDAAVIDVPQDSAKILAEFIKSENLHLRYIINTHGHFDHIYENAKLKAITQAKIACHKDDKMMLEDPEPKAFIKFRLDPTTADILLSDRDEVKFGGISLKVVHTPGHTPGSICLYSEIEKVMFTGDTLFKGTYGRTDLWGGDDAKMRESLQKLAGFPKNTRVLPGHDDETSISDEIEWLRGT